MNLRNGILGLLAERGERLSDAASSRDVMDALDRVYQRLVSVAKSDRKSAAAIGNEFENRSQDSRVEALANEVALANEFKDARTGHVEALVDAAITQGKVSVAERDERINRLLSATDFRAERRALAEEKRTFLTTGFHS